AGARPTGAERQCGLLRRRDELLDRREARRLRRQRPAWPRRRHEAEQALRAARRCPALHANGRPRDPAPVSRRLDRRRPQTLSPQVVAAAAVPRPAVRPLPHVRLRASLRVHVDIPELLPELCEYLARRGWEASEIGDGEARVLSPSGRKDFETATMLLA